MKTVKCFDCEKEVSETQAHRCVYPDVDTDEPIYVCFECSDKELERQDKERDLLYKMYS